MQNLYQIGLAFSNKLNYVFSHNDPISNIVWTFPWQIFAVFLNQVLNDDQAGELIAE